MREMKEMKSELIDIGLRKFFYQFVETALWSTTDESDPSGAPLDANYTASDIHPTAVKRMEKECREFYLKYHTRFSEAEPDRYGHDFWLTRNGHGAGFWDGSYPKHGDFLTEKSEAYGECDLYVGDDGKIHIG